MEDFSSDTSNLFNWVERGLVSAAKECLCTHNNRESRPGGLKTAILAAVLPECFCRVSKHQKLLEFRQRSPGATIVLLNGS